MEKLEIRIKKSIEALTSIIRTEWDRSINPAQSQEIKKILRELTSSHRHSNGEIIWNWATNSKRVGWENTGNSIGDNSAYYDYSENKIYADHSILSMVAYEKEYGESLYMAQRLEQERIGLFKVQSQIQKLKEKEKKIEMKIKTLSL